MTNIHTKASDCGYTDGFEWDLSGFDSLEEALVTKHGWDDATINAMGRTACAEAWGVDPEDNDAFLNAAGEYNRGVLDGLKARV